MSESLPALAERPTAGQVALLDEDVIALAQASRSDNTLKAYRSAMNAFRSWCSDKTAASLPAEPETVAAYMVHRMKSGAKAASLSVALSAIRHWHEEAGLPNPAKSKGVQDVMRGIRRTIGTASNQKAPATSERLAAMLTHMPKALKGKRDKAIVLLGFAGAFRRSELAAIRIEDMTFGPEGLDVLLPFSKTDQEGEGHSVAIPHGRNLLPVEAVRQWINAAGITKGPLFRPINKAGAVGKAALTDRSIAEIVKTYARLAGFDATEFSGHSMRAGFVTSASERGADINRIMDVTRHTDPRTVRKYIRRANRYRDHAGDAFL